MDGFIDTCDFVGVAQVDPAGVAAAVAQVAGVLHESSVLDAVGRAVAEAAVALDGARRPRLGGAGRRRVVLARGSGASGCMVAVRMRGPAVANAPKRDMGTIAYHVKCKLLLNQRNRGGSNCSVAW